MEILSNNSRIQDLDIHEHGVLMNTVAGFARSKKLTTNQAIARLLRDQKALRALGIGSNELAALQSFNTTQVSVCRYILGPITFDAFMQDNEGANMLAYFMKILNAKDAISARKKSRHYNFGLQPSLLVGLCQYAINTCDNETNQKAIGYQGVLNTLIDLVGVIRQVAIDTITTGGRAEELVNPVRNMMGKIATPDNEFKCLALAEYKRLRQISAIALKDTGKQKPIANKFSGYSAINACLDYNRGTHANVGHAKGCPILDQWHIERFVCKIYISLSQTLNNYIVVNT